MDVIKAQLDVSTDKQKTDAVYIPEHVSYIGVVIPDLNNTDNPSVGLEMYNWAALSNGKNGVDSSKLAASADTNWTPVLDNSDGSDAEICATAKDPGFVDITPFVASCRGTWIRFTLSVGTNATDADFYVYIG